MNSRSIDKKTFIEGLIWNYGSIIILALGGLIFNFLIVLFYNSETLGVFNQIYAYFLVISQVTVLGIHLSVLKYISSAEKEEEAYILNTGVLCVLIISLIFTVFLFFISSRLIHNKELYIGAMMTIPAIPFFSINKVLLNYLNGLSKMKEYAVFQSLRILSIILSIILISLLGINQNYICISLTLGEVLLFLCVGLYFIKNRYLRFKFSGKWYKKHMIFGIKAFPSNVVAELNTKIDIICLGWLISNNSLIGIYSFATLFTDGFYMIFIVVRRSINPHIARMYTFGEDNSFLFDKKKKGILYVLGILLNITLVAAVYFVCRIFIKEYLPAMVPLIIISSAITFNCFYIILGNTLSQIGIPEKESFLNCVALGSNFLLNLLLIPRFGIIGAAAATGISFFVYRFVLKHYIKKSFRNLII